MIRRNIITFSTNWLIQCFTHYRNYDILEGKSYAAYIRLQSVVLSNFWEIITQNQNISDLIFDSGYDCCVKIKLMNLVFSMTENLILKNDFTESEIRRIRIHRWEYSRTLTCFFDKGVDCIYIREVYLIRTDFKVINNTEIDKFNCIKCFLSRLIPFWSYFNVNVFKNIYSWHWINQLALYTKETILFTDSWSMISTLIWWKRKVDVVHTISYGPINEIHLAQEYEFDFYGDDTVVLCNFRSPFKSPH